MGDNPFDDEDPVASLLGVPSDADTIASPHPLPSITPHSLPPTTPSSSSGTVAKKNEISGSDGASSRGEK